MRSTDNRPYLDRLKQKRFSFCIQRWAGLKPTGGLLIINYRLEIGNQLFSVRVTFDHG